MLCLQVSHQMKTGQTVVFFILKQFTHKKAISWIVLIEQFDSSTDDLISQSVLADESHFYQNHMAATQEKTWYITT